MLYGILLPYINLVSQLFDATRRKQRWKKRKLFISLRLFIIQVGNYILEMHTQRSPVM